MKSTKFFVVFLTLALTFSIVKADNLSFSGNVGFVENKGQVVDVKGNLHPEVICTFDESNARLFFTKDKIVYLFYRYETVETEASRKKMSEGDVEAAKMLSMAIREQRIDFEFVNSNPFTETSFSNPSECKINYYKAHCPEGITNLTPYSEIRYNNLYPNIDVVFRATPKGMKYDIILKPGAKFSDIKFRYNGSEKISLKDGNLIIENSLTSLQEMIPSSYTEKDNQPYDVEYYLAGDNTFGFKPKESEEDSVNETIIIDPILLWSTYFEPSASGASYIRANTTVDVNGNFFYQVNTYAANMPLANPGGLVYYDPSYNPPSGLDIYFAKFDVNYQLVWSTYLGGTGNQSNYYDHGLATYNGYFFICGNTNSNNFPLLNQGGGAYYYTYPGTTCGFLSKFVISTGQMIHSTYLRTYDYHSMAIDNNGNIAIGSFNYTWSVAPVVMNRAGAYNQATHGGDSDVFIEMLNSSLVKFWGTYFGGVGYIDMMGMTFDNNNNLFLLTRGSSNTSTPLANPGGGAYYVSTVAGSYDLSISKFNTSGALTWSTYYGGSALEGLSYSNIRCNSNNDIIITSETFSTNFPTANQGGSAFFQGTAPTVTTGISAFDRAETVRTLIDPATKLNDLVMPGHTFPLRAQEGGVLRRAGHTEASVDLAKMAGLYPAAVICEVMAEDGTMARLPELERFAAEHDLKMLTIDRLIRRRMRSEKLIQRIAEVDMPTDYGDFRAVGYESLVDGQCHLALVAGDPSSDDALVRVHSECLTGDVFGSRRCDCGDQLHLAMRLIAENGNGVLLYMRQEGRGIGLANKLRAYALQERGYDTVEANHRLGYPADLRDYGVGAQILVDLGIKRMRLLTNNPRKIVGLEGYGLEIVDRIAIEIPPNDKNRRYLETKRDKLHHLLLQEGAGSGKD